MKIRLARLLATWFGCGYAPVGPGTAGAAAAVAIGFVLHFGSGAYALAGVLCGAIGIWASTIEARTSGRKDPGHIVIDEVAGQWITLAGATSYNWKSCLLGFVLFRLFDIWKPPPVRHFESLPEGTGIMADDLMAGVYGAVVLYLAGSFNIY